MSFQSSIENTILEYTEEFKRNQNYKNEADEIDYIIQFSPTTYYLN